MRSREGRGACGGARATRRSAGPVITPRAAAGPLLCVRPSPPRATPQPPRHLTTLSVNPCKHSTYTAAPVINKKKVKNIRKLFAALPTSQLVELCYNKFSSHARLARCYSCRLVSFRLHRDTAFVFAWKEWRGRLKPVKIMHHVIVKAYWMLRNLVAPATIDSRFV